jgi:hypothetical protein
MSEDTPYMLTPTERDELDEAIQRIPSGGVEEALYTAFRLQVKHDLSGLQMTVSGYEGFLVEADALLRETRQALIEARRALDETRGMAEKLLPIVSRVEVLEARIDLSSRVQDQIKERLRTVERKVAVLESKGTIAPMTDGPGD